MNSVSVPETTNPAATLRATDWENSFICPLNISIIFFELYSAFFPFKFSLFTESIPKVFGSIVNSLIIVSFSSTTFVFANGYISSIPSSLLTMNA